MRRPFLAVIAAVFVASVIPARGASPFDGGYQGVTKLVRSNVRASAGSGGCAGNSMVIDYASQTCFFRWEGTRR
jgi:hypothetical protein